MPAGPEKQQPLLRKKGQSWRNRLYRWLAAREYSGFEVRQRLLREGCPGDCAEQLLEEFLHRRLIDDSRCAQARCRALVQRGYGADRIRHDLTARGIAAELIDPLLKEQDWPDSARRSLRRRFGEAGVGTEAAARYLAARGFDEDTVIKVAGLDCDTSGDRL